MDKIDQQYLNEIVGGTESGEVDTQHDLKVHEENTTIEELEVQCVVIRGQVINSFTFFYNVFNILIIFRKLWLRLILMNETLF